MQKFFSNIISMIQPIYNIAFMLIEKMFTDGRI